ncbi:MAG: hypothetical protein WKF94_01975 [Solirubrobacteraceae bacterium]
MAHGALTLYVKNPGHRADEILSHTATELGLEGALSPADDGFVRVGLTGNYAASRDELERALQTSGPDWHQHVQLSSPRAE